MENTTINSPARISATELILNEFCGIPGIKLNVISPNVFQLVDETIENKQSLFAKIYLKYVGSEILYDIPGLLESEVLLPRNLFNISESTDALNNHELLKALINKIIYLIDFHGNKESLSLSWCNVAIRLAIIETKSSTLIQKYKLLNSEHDDISVNFDATNILKKLQEVGNLDYKIEGLKADINQLNETIEKYKITIDVLAKYLASTNIKAEDILATVPTASIRDLVFLFDQNTDIPKNTKEEPKKKPLTKHERDVFLFKYTEGVRFLKHLIESEKIAKTDIIIEDKDKTGTIEEIQINATVLRDIIYNDGTYTYDTKHIDIKYDRLIKIITHIINSNLMTPDQLDKSTSDREFDLDTINKLINEACHTNVVNLIEEDTSLTEPIIDENFSELNILNNTNIALFNFFKAVLSNNIITTTRLFELVQLYTSDKGINQIITNMINGHCQALLSPTSSISINISKKLNQILVDLFNDLIINNVLTSDIFNKLIGSNELANSNKIILDMYNNYIAFDNDVNIAREINAKRDDSSNVVYKIKDKELTPTLYDMPTTEKVDLSNILSEKYVAKLREEYSDDKKLRDQYGDILNTPAFNPSNKQ